MSNQLTIEDFNRMIGQETHHPLVTVFRSQSTLIDGHSSLFSLPSSLTCECYALIYNSQQASLRLYCPGDMIAFPRDDCEGVLFHPDLLCGSHLERGIAKYPVRCRCKALTGNERGTIVDSLSDIDIELHRPIDRYTSLIIVSHIGLLLDYCVRFCDNKSEARCLKRA